MSAGSCFVALASLIAGEVDLPGTQPSELTNPVEPSSSCNCHLNFAMEFTEPGQTYRATAMALAGRDPLFRAALAVAARDRPELADLCIRCHVPIGWLNGRSTPSDGSALTLDDLDSVTCDTCHRMIPTPNGPQLIGSGQYTLSNDTTKRARRGNRPENGHAVEASTFIGSSEMCGACHSLFNPAESAHDARGVNLGFAYYEQRTYEEWKDSELALPGGKQCADCHMQRVTGKAARQGLIAYNDLARHAIVGANDFVAHAVNLIDPLVALQPQELMEVTRLVDESLQSSARLTITSTLTRPVRAVGLDQLDVGVRLENLTGHKLPTGYPEGRRVYLEVRLELSYGATVLVSGAWDEATGMLIPDPQLRTYETQHGRVEAGTSTRTHHLIEMNQVRSDTRIPPRGFMPHAPDMIPEGRDYGSSAPYRNYDDVMYRIEMPNVTDTVTATLTINARYMFTDGEVVGFLLRALPGSIEANNLNTAWEGLDHVPPRLIDSVTIPIVITKRPPPPPDAGVREDTGTDPGPDPGEEGGCACTSASRESATPLLLLGLLSFFTRRRDDGARDPRRRALRARPTKTPRR